MGDGGTQMKNILIIHTGGTISMEENTSTGEVNTTSEHPLSEATKHLKHIANITDEAAFHVPSPHMQPRHMLQLGQLIHERFTEKKFDGIVVTHGTDTLEETAYFLDLFLQTRKPVIVTGAMRSANEIGADGLYNLITAVRVASSDEAHEKGTLVVMNDEIHTAKSVTKTSTSNVATFQSPQYGPIGITTKQEVFFHHKITYREAYPVQQLSKNVVLLKVYAGMDGSIIDSLLDSRVDGLVIEALGQGNVPPSMIGSLTAAVEAGVPVLVVSRCYQGFVQPTYAYEGGGKHLEDIGLIFANGLNGPKARIKLMLALEMTNNRAEIISMFQ
ncbi:L-asparaginase [Salimicrobium jeotgali]|uniref:asparaginase n=2 Tax=Salimicrobium jeotgali TaxID=1230341 RepID=K2HAH6_9BACI|nr:L-asparaginase [Salimicrobium jeotgali]